MSATLGAVCGDCGAGFASISRTAWCRAIRRGATGIGGSEYRGEDLQLPVALESRLARPRPEAQALRCSLPVSLDSAKALLRLDGDQGSALDAEIPQKLGRARLMGQEGSKE